MRPTSTTLRIVVTKSRLPYRFLRIAVYKRRHPCLVITNNAAFVFAITRSVRRLLYAVILKNIYGRLDLSNCVAPPFVCKERRFYV